LGLKIKINNTEKSIVSALQQSRKERNKTGLRHCSNR